MRMRRESNQKEEAKLEERRKGIKEMALKERAFRLVKTLQDDPKSTLFKTIRKRDIKSIRVNLTNKGITEYIYQKGKIRASRKKS